ncbi:carbohydrate-binding-like protein [Auriculariales sp. MPI-PUGE-AT-0066]|nr:carbohydrate-binding-like protein [Auriculariales sp. MPI-PUGE-AT-0066]
MAPPASPQAWPTSPVQLRYAMQQKRRSSGSVGLLELDESGSTGKRDDAASNGPSTLTNGRSSPPIPESSTEGKYTNTVQLKQPLAKNEPPKPPTDVTFEIASHALTQWGQHVFVVGDLPELGCWDPEKAIKLSSNAYPVWKANLKLPAQTEFQYKYIRKAPASLLASTPNTGSLRVHDAWL